MTRAIVAVLLGAEWPIDSKPAHSFLLSANAFQRYLQGDLGVPDTNLLCLFNSAANKSEQIEQIRQFLKDRVAVLENQEIDVLVYFVGHGEPSEDRLYFALRSTDLGTLKASALAATDLKEVLLSTALHSRWFLILDCCYAALAQSEFTIASAKGVVLLCSSSSSIRSEIEPDSMSTRFARGLLNVLQAADAIDSEIMRRVRDLLRRRQLEFEPALSTRQVGDLISAILQERYGDEAVVPEVHAPDARHGDLAESLFFPNPFSVGDHARSAPHPPPQALDNVLRCFVVVSESDGRARPNVLGQFVTQALETFADRIQNESGLEVSLTPEVWGICSLLSSPERLAVAVQWMCRAQVVVFDASGYEPGVMLMMGIRSVVRRGVTISTVGRSEGFPFNLQQVSFSDHSEAFLQERGEPYISIGERIVEGLRSLRYYPDYLDLPAYAAVRTLPPDVKNWLPKAYYERVLVLCPFGNDYEETWELYLEPALRRSTKAKSNQDPAIRDKASVRPSIVRTLDMNSPQLVTQALYQGIRLTAMCVADLTYWRPNVLFEIGVRLATHQTAPVCILNGKDASAEAHGACEQYGLVQTILGPIRYMLGPGNQLYCEGPAKVDAGHAVVERHRSLASAANPIYSVIVSWFDWRAEDALIPPHVLLSREANWLSSPHADSEGVSPLLYPKNRDLTTYSERGALHRRLAAWYYIDNMYSDEQKVEDKIFKDYSKLGNSIVARLDESGAEQDKARASAIRAQIQKVKDSKKRGRI